MSASIPNQDPQRTGDNIAVRLTSSEIANRPIQAVHDLVLHMQNNVGFPDDPFDFNGNYWVGKIIATPGGLTAFTGPDYWVTRQMVTSGATGDHLIIFYDEAIPGAAITINARNAAEDAAGTHSLTVGTKVIVFEFDARDGTGRRQYVFDSGGTGGGETLAKQVIVVFDSGADGDGTTPAQYAYRMYARGDTGHVTQIGSTMQPQRARETPGSYLPAADDSPALALWDTDLVDWALWDCSEVENVNLCDDDGSNVTDLG